MKIFLLLFSLALLSPPPTFALGMDEYLPIDRVPPHYPRKALKKKLVGWVIVEFTVTVEGTVKNPRVVENCAFVPPFHGSRKCSNSPNKVFDKSALKAVSKFKYEPRTIYGAPVETENVQNKVTYEMGW